MKYFIYTSKMQYHAIYLSVFVNKVLFKYRIENFSHKLRKNAPRKSAKAHMKLYMREMLTLVMETNVK